MSEKLPNHAWEVRATGKAQCRNCGIIMLDNDRRDTLRYGRCTATPPASQESAGEAVYQLECKMRGYTYWIDCDKSTYETEKKAGGPCRVLYAASATLTAELAEAREQRDRLAQENLERAEAVIAQAANARSLADALKKLNNAARISGGVAGADKNLMDACENAERALSLTGTGRAVNAVLDVLERRRVTDARLHEVAALCAATERQRDSLRDECERLRGVLHTAMEALRHSRPWDAGDAIKAALSASGREGAAPAIAK